MYVYTYIYNVYIISIRSFHNQCFSLYPFYLNPFCFMYILFYGRSILNPFYSNLFSLHPFCVSAVARKDAARLRIQNACVGNRPRSTRGQPPKDDAWRRIRHERPWTGTTTGMSQTPRKCTTDRSRRRPFNRTHEVTPETPARQDDGSGNCHTAATAAYSPQIT